jgi:hypothetical protein
MNFEITSEYSIPSDEIDEAISLTGDNIDEEQQMEQRIDQWLTEQGITLCSVEDKQDNYSNRQKSLSLSTNHSNVSPFNISERMNTNSLLQRRNLKLDITAIKRKSPEKSRSKESKPKFMKHCLPLSE